MRRIKRSEIKPIRESLIIDQRGHCAVCDEIMDKPVLDHAHFNLFNNTNSGHCRAVICASCNLLIGKIENAIRLNRISENRLKTIFDRFIEYTATTSEFYHPTHKLSTDPKKKKKRLKKDK